MLRIMATVCAGVLGLGIGMDNYANKIQYNITCEEYHEAWEIIKSEVEMVDREEDSVRVNNFKDEYCGDNYVVSCDIEGYWYEWSDEEECLIGDYRRVETITITYDDCARCKVLYEY